MTKLLSAIVAAVFAVASLTPAFAQGLEPPEIAATVIDKALRPLLVGADPLSDLAVLRSTDGGLVAAELGISDIPVCGLAKRLEEVWVPDEEDPVILPRSSEGLYLLQRVRDEAHRFAINHHRNRRSKSMVESLLDDVPGLGEVRRKTLLRHFGSLRKLRAATLDEIALVPGIGPRTAGAIKAALGEDTSGSDAGSGVPDPQ